jgi:hypothetical protein
VGQLWVADHREIVADGVNARIGREKWIFLRDQTADGVLDAEIEGLCSNRVVEGSRGVALAAASGTVANGKALPKNWSGLTITPKVEP